MTVHIRETIKIYYVGLIIWPKQQRPCLWWSTLHAGIAKGESWGSFRGVLWWSLDIAGSKSCFRFRIFWRFYMGWIVLWDLSPPFPDLTCLIAISNSRVWKPWATVSELRSVARWYLHIFAIHINAYICVWMIMIIWHIWHLDTLTVAFF